MLNIRNIKNIIGNLLGNKFLLIFLLLIFLIVLSNSSYAAVCGNGACERGENKCNCSLDCGICEGDVEGLVCQEYTCRTGDCRPTIKLNCCGNGICEGSESSGTCVPDCSARALTVQILSPKEGESFPRGALALVKVRVRTELDAALASTVTVSGFFGSNVLYDDGVHNDDAKDDGVYANNIIIPNDAKEGSYDFEVSSLLAELTITEKVSIKIEPQLSFTLESSKEFYALGQRIDVNGFIQRKDESLSIDVKFEILSEDNELIYEETAKSNDKGFYSFVYNSSLIDPQGKWAFRVSTEDQFSNKGLFEKKFEVSKTAAENYFGLVHVLPVEGIYRRGEKLQILVELTRGNDVKDPILKTTLPGGRIISLEKITESKYGGNLYLGSDTPIGSQTITTTAEKDVDNVRLSGSDSINIKVVETKVLVEILEPKKTDFEFGDKVDLQFRLTYDSGEPVNNADINLLVNKTSIPYTQVAEGVYSASYEIFESDNGKIFLKFTGKDSFGNIGSKDLTINVLGTSLNYWLVKQQLVVIAVVALFLIVVAVFVPPRLKKSILKNLESKIIRLKALEKELQKSYFQQGTISQDDYSQLNDSYKLQIERLEQKIEFWNKLIKTKESYISTSEEVTEKVKASSKAETASSTSSVKAPSGSKPSSIPLGLSLFVTFLLGFTPEALKQKALAYLDYRLEELNYLRHNLNKKLSNNEIPQQEFNKLDSNYYAESKKLIQKRKILSP